MTPSHNNNVLIVCAVYREGHFDIDDYFIIGNELQILNTTDKSSPHEFVHIYHYDQ